MANKDQLFSIGPDEIVGTEILDNKMPSNLDFDAEKPALEMTDISHKPKHSSPQKQQQQNFDIENLNIKSYSLKGHTIFNLPPQFPINSIAPPSTHTFQAKALSQQDYNNGLWGIWDNLRGYVNREMSIDQGYIYLFARQKTGLLCVSVWRLVDIFKVFVDLQQFQLRMVFKSEGSETLITRDYQSAQLKNLLARINEQISAIGLSLVG